MVLHPNKALKWGGPPQHLYGIFCMALEATVDFWHWTVWGFAGSVGHEMKCKQIPRGSGTEEKMSVGKVWTASDISGCKKVLGLFRDMDMLMCLGETCWVVTVARPKRVQHWPKSEVRPLEFHPGGSGTLCGRAPQTKCLACQPSTCAAWPKHVPSFSQATLSMVVILVYSGTDLRGESWSPFFGQVEGCSFP